MREQTIVWRNDFVDMFEDLEWDSWLYKSKLCLVRSESNEMVIGNFRAYEKCFDELHFMSTGGFNYEVSLIKEFAFLE